MAFFKKRSLPETQEIVLGKSVKINKYAIHGINTLLMLFMVLRNISVVGLLSFLVITGLTALWVFKRKREVPAIADVPQILLADVFMYIGTFTADVLNGFNLDDLSAFFEDVKWFSWAMVVAGVVLGMITVGRKGSRWFTGIAGGLIGSGFISAGFKNPFLIDMSYPYAGVSILTVFLIVVFLWTILLYFICKTVPERSGAATFSGVVLLLLFIADLLLASEHLKAALPFCKTGLISVIYGSFEWWKIIIFCALILAGAFVLGLLDEEKGGHLSVDTYALVIMFEIVMTSKLLITFYFSYGILVLLGLLAGTFICIRNDYLGRKTLGLGSVFYLPAQYLVTVLAIILFSNGLWLNVLLGGVLYVALRAAQSREKRRGEANTAIHWTIILIWIVGEAVALVWRMCFNIDLLVMLGAILILGVATILTINLKQPGGRKASVVVNGAVCGVIALLCLSLLTRVPVRFKYSTDGYNENVIMTVQPKDKDNQIISTYYYYKNIFGKKIRDDYYIKSQNEVIPISGETLTVVVEDEHGFVTTKTIWYPYELWAFLDRERLY